VEEALINGAVGLAGALIGGGLTYVASREAWRRTLSADTLDEIAGIHDIAWHEVSWVSGQKTESRIRSRLALLGVEERHADEAFTAAWTCWRYIKEQEELGGDPDGKVGLESSIHDRFTAAQRALGEQLRR
jgi:hypothetical protein